MLFLDSVVYGVVFVVLDAMFIVGYSMLAIKTFNSQVGSKLKINVVSGIGLALVGTLLIWNGLSLV